MFLQLTNKQKEDEMDFDILLNLEYFSINTIIKQRNKEDAKTKVIYTDYDDKKTKSIDCIEKPENIVNIINEFCYGKNKFLKLTEIKNENKEQDIYLNLNKYSIKYVQKSIYFKDVNSEIVYYDNKDNLTYVRFCREEPQIIVNRIKEIKNG